MYLIIFLYKSKNIEQNKSVKNYYHAYSHLLLFLKVIKLNLIYAVNYYILYIINRSNIILFLLIFSIKLLFTSKKFNISTNFTKDFELGFNLNSNY
jgi:hypothetical protein